MPGQIEFFDVSFDVLAPTSRSSIIGPTQKMNKVVFRAVAQSLPPGPIAVDMPCVMTAEVFDAATGKTEIFIGNPDLLPASLVGS
jgi:hypothetical protein